LGTHHPCRCLGGLVIDGPHSVVCTLKVHERQNRTGDAKVFVTDSSPERERCETAFGKDCSCELGLSLRAGRPIEWKPVISPGETIHSVAAVADPQRILAPQEQHASG
jgi:hypothetical protein